MRKIICLLGAVAMCFALVCPAFATGSVFVPSITYKDGPDMESAEMNGEDVAGCLVVTTIPSAKDKSTDISQEARDLLLEVYEKLEDGSMVLPLEERYVIRELVDVSFGESSCVEPGHGHKEALEEPGTRVTVKFDLDIPQGTDVTVLIYHDGQWKVVEGVTNNGDGTITCEFEDICPVAFCVDPDFYTESPKTGDEMGRSMILWIALMAVSLAGIVILLASRRKKDAKK